MFIEVVVVEEGAAAGGAGETERPRAEERLGAIVG